MSYWYSIFITMNGKFLTGIAAVAFSAAAGISGCGSAVEVTPQAQSAIVAGRIVNLTDSSSHVFTAIDCNPWSRGGRHAVIVDSAGYFKTTVNMLFGHNFTVYYDGNFLCSYAEPGDSIFMEIDAKHPEKGASYGGSNAPLNNEYGKAYGRLFGSFWSNNLASPTAPAEEFMSIFKQKLETRYNKISAYSDSAGLSPECTDLMRRTALFSLANAAMDYRGSSPMEALEFFADPIFGLDNDSNAREMMFPYHLSAYLNRLEEAIEPSSTAAFADSIAARHPRSLNRDIMLAILRERENSSYRIPSELFADTAIYHALYPDQYATYLPTDDMRHAGIYRFDNGELKSCGDVSLTELIKKEYSGKTVYLDLWATWCGPCRVSHASLPEVADFFADNDKIVFMTVAMKSNMELWKKLIGDMPTNCHSYIVTSDDATEVIMSAYNMDGFPKYLVVGPDGKIIDNDPPRPNSPAIFDTLTEILRQQ